MKKNLRLDGTLVSQYSNILHAQFQRRQYELVKAADATKINVPAEWLAEWEKAIKVEVEINKQATASVLTAKLKKKDEERDLLLTNIFSVVRAQRTSPVSSIREAAERLYVIFKPYFGIQNDMAEAEGGHVIGMENDAAKHQSDVEALGLKPVMNELHTVNSEYEEMRVDRRMATVDTKLPEARVARRNSDDFFEGACHCILAAYIQSKTEDDKKVVAHLVDGMNQVSSDFKAMHNSSMAQKKRGDDGTGKKPREKKKKETEEEKLARLLPEFEKANDYAAGSLSITGKTFEHEGSKIYQISINKSETDTIWVQVKRNKLVQVGYIEKPA